METTFFGQTSEMGQIFPETIFFLKISHIQLNKLFWCFDAFLRISTETSLLGQKIDYLRKQLRITQNVIFSPTHWKMANT